MWVSALSAGKRGVVPERGSRVGGAELKMIPNSGMWKEFRTSPNSGLRSGLVSVSVAMVLGVRTLGLR